MTELLFTNIPAAFKGLPHQVKALEFLQANTSPSLLKEFEAIWDDDPSKKQPPTRSEPKPGRWSNPLAVPYFSQRDSTVAGQANRMCFSSSCAMLVAYFKPNALPKSNGDDVYLKRVLGYGDTTDASAQIKALDSFGLKARFIMTADLDVIRYSIDSRKPIACGYLHHGPSTAPSGGGHWLTVVGYTDDGVIVNDPFGEMNVANGGYLNPHGEGLHYSYLNWGPRWMADGPSTGWAILVESF